MLYYILIAEHVSKPSTVLARPRPAHPLWQHLQTLNRVYTSIFQLLHCTSEGSGLALVWSRTHPVTALALASKHRKLADQMQHQRQRQQGSKVMTSSTRIAVRD